MPISMNKGGMIHLIGQSSNPGYDLPDPECQKMPVFKPIRRPEWTRPSLPPTAVRTRTGLIFFFGIAVLILVTLGASLWIDEGIDQAELRLEVIENLRAPLMQMPLSVDEEQYIGRMLNSLLEGGEVPRPNGSMIHLRRPGNEALVQSLETALISFDRLQNQPQTSNSRSDEFELQSVADLHQALDQVVSLLQIDRADKLGMMRGLFASLFLSTSCYLLIGLWFTEEFIAKPFEDLIGIASRIAAGDLDTPIRLNENDGYGELAQSFESMRLELRASREHLARWADELEARVEQRSQQLTALARVITAASRSLELEEVLRVALEQAMQVLGVETGGVWLLDEDSGDLHLAVSQGMSKEMQDQIRYVKSGEGATGRAARSGETIVLEDLGHSSSLVKMAAIREGMLSLIAVPIKVHDRIVGVLDVMTRERRSYTAEEIAMLTSIGQQIGVGVENASLIQEIREQTERVAALQEREMISAELHDGLLQNLGYLHLKADQLEFQAISHGLPEMALQLAHQRQLLEETSAEIRRFISDLRTTPPASASLHSALERMVNRFMKEFPLKVTLIEESNAGRMKADHVAHLVRIAREALINAVRHGNASQAVLIYTNHGTMGELNIQDNGSGFQPECVPKEGTTHFGLSIMRARATRLGGQLIVHSVPNEGTRVTVKWPLEIA